MKSLSAAQIIEFNRLICIEYNIEHAVLNENLVESAIGSAFFELSDVGFVHGALPEISAALCYKIIKNHAFRDANKRTAAVASLVLLELNAWLLIYEEYEDGTEFQKIIEGVASNSVTADQLKEWFAQHVKPSITQ